MASTKELRALITLAGKVDPSLQAAMMKANKMNLNMVQQSQKSAGSMNKVWTIAKGVFAGNIMTKGLSLAVNGIKSVGSQGIELASDLTEVQNVVDTTFGGSSKLIDEWSDKALSAFGLSQLQAKKFTGTMGAMLKSSGISDQYLVKMSEGLTGLAGDFASFYNLDQEEAFDKIRSGISGETEPLKQLGINMSVANLQAFAMSKGIKTSYDKMDQASQTLLRYNYLMEKSKDAQGDFSKTLETSYANQKRLLTTNLSQKMATLWNKSLPQITKGVEYLNKTVTGLNIDAISNSISNGLGTVFTLASQYGPPLISNVKEFGNSAYNAYLTIKPAIAFTLTSAIPAIAGIASKLIQCKPLVYGVVGAFAAYKLIMIGATIAQEAHNAILLVSAIRSGGLALAQGALAGAEGSATIAQWALNAAMSANPIGLVVLGIGALIAAGVLLYQNFDTVRNGAIWLWDKFTGIIHGMPDFALALTGPLAPLLLLIKHFDKVREVAGGAIGAVKKFFGFGSKDSGNSESSTDASMLVSKNLPAYASGGFANSPSIFAEDGPEAAIPIKYKNPRSIAILNQTAKAIGATASGGGNSVTINLTINAPGGDPEKIKGAAQTAKEELLDLLDEYFGGRPSFG